MQQPSLRSILLFLGNILTLSACAIFASGFFPYKPFIAGLAQHEPLPHGAAPDAPFEKLIFMVVDALRSDFVFSQQSGFTFAQSLVKEGAGLPFTAHASAPTVTMPRIKALTTGSIPSFVDMILNIAESDKSSTLAEQDTWLAQMLQKPGGKAVMYGDDTWLKLFPDTFARADGTSSFFVSDFTEVDNNVTRHLPEELASSDWNVMIMHYLGMDHIGHKSGPNSHNMLPKQQEMDNIVQQVYQAIESQPHLASTLFVLAGDHGMNDVGNHGGSAPGETSPALLFMSPKFKNISDGLPCPINPVVDYDYYTRAQQSDLAPTLAGLLGFPVPLNNLGIILSPLLQMWPSEDDRIKLLLRNALQMLNIVKAQFSHPVFRDSRASVSCESALSDEDELACAWKEASVFASDVSACSAHPTMAIASLIKFCMLAQSILSHTASNYDVKRLWTGVAVMSAAVLLCAFCCVTRLRLYVSFAGVTFACVGVAYMATMFASSFVEEEQQFWYWVMSAWISIQTLRRQGVHWKPASCILVLLRLSRQWNQSGQKHQGASDIAKTIARAPVLGPPVLWALVAMTYVEFARMIYYSTFRGSGQSKFMATTATILITLASAAFKIIFAAFDAPELLGSALESVIQFSQHSPDLVTLARVVFILLAASMVLVLLGRRHNSSLSPAYRIYPILQHLLVMQIRTTSIPLLLALHAIISLIPSLRLQGFGLALTSIALGKFAYFSFGGTNAISSLDLSLSYNGIAAYEPVLVGMLLLISNFGTAILASFAVISGSTLQQCSSNTGSEDGCPDQLGKKMLLTKQIGNDMQAAVIRGPSYGQEKSDDASERDPASDSIEGRTSQNASRTSSGSELDILSLWVSIETLAVMAGCAWLREHLFVWTVFSPRFLYGMAWVLGWHMLGNLGLSLLVSVVG